MGFFHGNLQPYKVQSTSRFRIVAVIILALVYATILANLPLLEFKDREYYLQYATSSNVILERYQSRGLSSIIFNEPIWLLINVTLKSILEPELVVRAIIFIGAFLTAYTFLRLSSENILILILLLLIPQVLKNHITHLRQGLGLGFFMFGMLFSDWRRSTFIGLAPFIHSSFFFIIALTQVDRIIQLFINFSIEVKMILLFITSIIFSSNLQKVLAVAGDRRAAYYGVGTAESSGLGWLFWFLVLVLILTSGKHWLNKYTFSIYALVFYLTTYFLIEVTARIFESSMCLVLLACLNLKGSRIYVFLSAMIVYGLFQWTQRLNSTPMF
jgi:hypothetical protein